VYERSKNIYLDGFMKKNIRIFPWRTQQKSIMLSNVIIEMKIWNPCKFLAHEWLNEQVKNDKVVC